MSVPSYLVIFSFALKLPQVVEGKIGIWSLPSLLLSQLEHIISGGFFLFSPLVSWFYYLGKVLSFVFNLSNTELSGVRQPTPYWEINNTEAFAYLFLDLKFLL